MKRIKGEVYMKRFCRGLALVLATLMLLCSMACSPDDPSPSTEGEQDGESTFDVQAEENETIIPLPLTGKADVKSYLRLVYADIYHTQLTHIFAHHLTDSGERVPAEIFCSLGSEAEDEVMVLLRWYVGDDGGEAKPSLVLFREYNYEREGEVMVNASCVEYEFYYKTASNGEGVVMDYFSKRQESSISAPLNEPWQQGEEIHNFLYHYEDFYEREFEREPRQYQHDLVYSRINGKETKMKRDLRQVFPFPWTRIREALENET
jgi:hypothetical protein